MNVGETATIGGYTFRFDGTQEVKGPNYIAARGTFHVSQDGRDVTVMYPEKRRYIVQNQTMTEAAISPGFAARSVCVVGRASSRAEPGVCGSTTSPLSIGSGVAV